MIYLCKFLQLLWEFELTFNINKYRTKQQDLFNAMGSMYAAILFVGVKNANSVQPVVSVERTVFYRERAAGMYSALSYAFAQVRTICQAFVNLVILLNSFRKTNILI